MNKSNVIRNGSLRSLSQHKFPMDFEMTVFSTQGLPLLNQSINTSVTHQWETDLPGKKLKRRMSQKSVCFGGGDSGPMALLMQSNPEPPYSSAFTEHQTVHWPTSLQRSCAVRKSKNQRNMIMQLARSYLP